MYIAAVLVVKKAASLVKVSAICWVLGSRGSYLAECDVWFPSVTVMLDYMLIIKPSRRPESRPVERLPSAFHHRGSRSRQSGTL